MTDHEPLIYDCDDVLSLLDSLLVDRGGGWWDGFFADRARPCPFFVDWPDESGLFGKSFLRAARLRKWEGSVRA